MSQGQGDQDNAAARGFHAGRNQRQHPRRRRKRVVEAMQGGPGIGIGPTVRAKKPASLQSLSQFGGPPQSATVETARLAPRRIKPVRRDPQCSWCHGEFEDVRTPVSACVNRTRPVTSLEVSAHFHRGDGVFNRKEQLNNKTETILIDITIIVLLILSEYKSIVGI